MTSNHASRKLNPGGHRSDWMDEKNEILVERILHIGILAKQTSFVNRQIICLKIYELLMNVTI